MLFLRFVAAALLTAFMGSCGGGFVTMLAAAPSAPPENLYLVWIIVTVIGFLISFPALLLVAAPLTLPFLSSMPQHPKAAALGFAVLGAFVALPAAMLTGTAGPGALLPAVVTGAASGCFWVIVLLWLRDPDVAE